MQKEKKKKKVKFFQCLSGDEHFMCISYANTSKWMQGDTRGKPIASREFLVEIDEDKKSFEYIKD